MAAEGLNVSKLWPIEIDPDGEYLGHVVEDAADAGDPVAIAAMSTIEIVHERERLKWDGYVPPFDVAEATYRADVSFDRIAEVLDRNGKSDLIITSLSSMIIDFSEVI
jgi:hypothetical protein